MRLVFSTSGVTALSLALMAGATSPAFAQLRPPEVRGLRGAPFPAMNPPPEVRSYGEGPQWDGRPPDGVQPAEQVEELHLPIGTSGLMLGRNRHGNPVVIRLFRPEHTRVLLVGGVRGAQLLVLRAMALGARVVVQTARPRVWEPFVRGAAVPGESIAVVPPGRVVEIAPGSALHPLLVVVDVGPVSPDHRPGGLAWRFSLYLCAP